MIMPLMLIVSFGLRKQKGRANPASPMRLNDRCQYIRGQRPEAQSRYAARRFSAELAVAVLFDDIRAELLALEERAHSGALDGGDMHEDVRLSAALLDEAEVFDGIEELHF